MQKSSVLKLRILIYVTKTRNLFRVWYNGPIYAAKVPVRYYLLTHEQPVAESDN